MEGRPHLFQSGAIRGPAAQAGPPEGDPGGIGVFFNGTDSSESEQVQFRIFCGARKEHDRFAVNISQAGKQEAFREKGMPSQWTCLYCYSPFLVSV